MTVTPEWLFETALKAMREKREQPMTEIEQKVSERLGGARIGDRVVIQPSGKWGKTEEREGYLEAYADWMVGTPVVLFDDGTRSDIGYHGVFVRPADNH